MLINSELPLCMLNENETLNEYDFVLFHLYKSNKAYRDYYKGLRMTNPDRLMILDNSAYEFYVKGEELDMDEFYNAILELAPDIYILPDTLMNKEKTLQSVVEFLDKYNIKCSTPMAVLQGNTVSEMLECSGAYKTLNIKYIAIPFHNRFFLELGERCGFDIWYQFDENYGTLIGPDALYAIGRVQFMKDYGCLLQDFDHIHMLGSHCPYEKSFYKDYQTMDTGYPVKCAVNGEELGEEHFKPSIIIDEFFEKYLEERYKELIRLNMEKFKSM